MGHSSDRVDKGDISIINDVRSPKCGHDRAWSNMNKDYIKCSKCGTCYKEK